MGLSRVAYRLIGMIFPVAAAHNELQSPKVRVNRQTSSISNLERQSFRPPLQGGPSASSQISELCVITVLAILVRAMRLTFGRGKRAKAGVEKRVG